MPSMGNIWTYGEGQLTILVGPNFIIVMVFVENYVNNCKGLFPVYFYYITSLHYSQVFRGGDQIERIIIIIAF